MHELSIAQNIIEIMEDYSQRVDDKKFKAVYLEVGEMSNVLVDSLQFSFNSLIEGTKFSSAKLMVEKISVRIICKNCKTKAELVEFNFSCKNCGSNQIEIVSGNELEISKIELYD